MAKKLIAVLKNSLSRKECEKMFDDAERRGHNYMTLAQTMEHAKQFELQNGKKEVTK